MVKMNAVEYLPIDYNLYYIVSISNLKFLYPWFARDIAQNIWKHKDPNW